MKELKVVQQLAEKAVFRPDIRMRNALKLSFNFQGISRNVFPLKTKSFAFFKVLDTHADCKDNVN